jgi:LPS sulfotransferase NodH
MAATGVLGEPDEYFNPRGPLPLWLRRYPAVNLTDYIQILRRERSTSNGVFSLKATFADIAPTLESGLTRELLGETHFVYLTRWDVIAQAISSYVAEESGVWHRQPSGDLYRSSGEGNQDPPFDEARILLKLEELVQMQQRWERTFALYSIEPLRICYEDVVADASAVVERIAGHVGVDWSGRLSLENAATAKLGNERNERWAQLIRAGHRL